MDRESFYKKKYLKYKKKCKKLDLIAGAEQPNIDRRALWKNALKLVEHFWVNEKPCAMGFQEMNDQRMIEGKQDGGIQEVFQTIHSIDPTVVAVVGQSIKLLKHDMSLIYPTCMLVFSTRMFGQPVFNFVYDLAYFRVEKDIQKTKSFIRDVHTLTQYSKPAENIYAIINPEESRKSRIKDILSKKFKYSDGKEDYIFKDSPETTGRPIIVSITEKGYVLVVVHGPNEYQDSFEGGVKLKQDINFALQHAIYKYNQINQAFIVHPKKIYFMGDFNDPHHSINMDTPLEIDLISPKSGKIIVSDGEHKQGGVKSCCYNYDTACPNGLHPDTFQGKRDRVDYIYHNDKEFKKVVLEETDASKKGEPAPLVGESNSCYTYDSKDNTKAEYWGNWSSTPKNIQKGPGTIKYPGRGALDTYIFTGDYCLANKFAPKGGLTVYRPDEFLGGKHIAKILSEDGQTTQYTNRQGNARKEMIVSLESDHEMVYARVLDDKDQSHTIANYNMSFASDLGGIFGSEKNFIQNGLDILYADS